MSTAHATGLITAEQFAEMNLDGPYELVRGEIVEMTRLGGLHGFVCTKVSGRLDVWAESIDFGCVLGNDSGFRTGRHPESVRGPDVMLIPWSQLPNRQLPTGWVETPPVLIVEVFSPSDRWNKMLAKVAEYHEAGVAEVWVVKPSSRSVHVFGLDADPIQLSETGVLSSRQLPGFQCTVASLFPPEEGG